MKDDMFYEIVYLTKKPQASDSGDVANVEPPQIEITPAMREAGARVLADLMETACDSVVQLQAEEIFRAMLSAAACSSEQ